MICQNAEGILPDAQKYSCRFNVIARAREVFGGEPWTVAEYNTMWREAKRCGIISGDLNRDGDFDDPGEDEILDDARLIVLLGVPLRVILLDKCGIPLLVDDKGIRRIAPTKVPLDSTRYWVLERWFWKQSHFIQGDGTGQARPLWDPLRGGSLTRERGRIMDLRVFEIVHKETA